MNVERATALTPAIPTSYLSSAILDGTKTKRVLASSASSCGPLSAQTREIDDMWCRCVGERGQLVARMLSDSADVTRVTLARPVCKAYTITRKHRRRLVGPISHV